MDSNIDFSDSSNKLKNKTETESNREGRRSSSCDVDQNTRSSPREHRSEETTYDQNGSYRNNDNMDREPNPYIAAIKSKAKYKFVAPTKTIRLQGLAMAPVIAETNGKFPASMAYTGIDIGASSNLNEWFCVKCGVRNFQQSLNCFRCQTSKIVKLSYCKYSMGDNKKPYFYDESLASSNAFVPRTYTMTDVENLAKQASGFYAKTTAEYLHYMAYYRDYYTKKITGCAGSSIPLHQGNEMVAANAVAQSATQHVNKNFANTTHMSIPNGTYGKKYSIPDVSKYTYDKNTGYQYDSSTGLYYDPNSNYYWNHVIRKYLYWDQEKMTYVLAPTTHTSKYTSSPTTKTYPSPTSTENTTSSQAIAAQSDTQESKAKKPKLETSDKVVISKRVVKDMKKWAKIFDQKKNKFCTKIGASSSSSSASTDYLPIKNTTQLVPDKSKNKREKTIATSIGTTSLVSIYCDNTTVLEKGKDIKLSDNLETRRESRHLEDRKEKSLYQDRSKERQIKYGDLEEAPANTLKQMFLESKKLSIGPVVASVSKPIGAENVGNKLLQKIGWTEGQGLGMQNQGITSIVQSTQHYSTVGLGNQTSEYTSTDEYKQYVRKVTQIQYQNVNKES